MSIFSVYCLIIGVQPPVRSVICVQFRVCIFFVFVFNTNAMCINGYVCKWANFHSRCPDEYERWVVPCSKRNLIFGRRNGQTDDEEHVYTPFTLPAKMKPSGLDLFPHCMLLLIHHECLFLSNLSETFLLQTQSWQRPTKLYTIWIYMRWNRLLRIMN